MLKTAALTDRIRISHFTSPSGCDEFYFAIRTSEGLPFPRALSELAALYETTLGDFGLGDDTVAFSRIFLSDSANQDSLLEQSPLYKRLCAGAVSIIEQEPVDGGPVSLLAYHITKNGAAIPKRVDRAPDGGRGNSARFAGDNYSLLFTAGFTSGPHDSPYLQTKGIFDSLSQRLKENELTLSGDLLRTWIFMRDIDRHYGDMVRARREFFEAHGLAAPRRSPASTGIDGWSRDPQWLVAVDALSMGGLTEEQVKKIEAPTHLPPALSYGVTFERGLEVRFGDRSHMYISGTASIDNQGKVLHIGDAEGQARRAVENVGALLATRNAGLGDIACVIAYVRNFHDRGAIATVLDQTLGQNVPLIFVEAPVCRPAWLFELEAIAVVPAQSEFPPFL